MALDGVTFFGDKTAPLGVLFTWLLIMSLIGHFEFNDSMIAVVRDLKGCCWFICKFKSLLYVDTPILLAAVLD